MFSANKNLFAQIIKKHWQESFTPILTSLAASSSLGEIYSLFCLHAHYLRPVLPFPLCSMLHLAVESKEMGCRAFPRAACFSLDCAPWSHKWTCTPSGVKESQRANTQHKNHQFLQISLQGRDILEHNARSLSLCSLVETVFRIHWHLIMCLISLLFRAAILVLCGGCHRNGCLILI